MTRPSLAQPVRSVLSLWSRCQQRVMFVAANKELNRMIKSSGKLGLLDKLLVRLKETGHRVLIFSQVWPGCDVLLMIHHNGPICCDA